jgi:DNA polymerase (family 10)
MGAEPAILSNAQIADRLAGLAQLLSTQKENLYKVKAYQRAAARIRSLSESLDEMVREDADLTRFPGIGEAIASAIREIVVTGRLRKLDALRSQAAPEVATLADYPRLDPKRIARIYKKLKISSIDELREMLEGSEIETVLGARMALHVRQGLSEVHAMLLYRADSLRDAVEEFLVEKCGVKEVQVTGACRRRVEIIEELSFVIQTGDFESVVEKIKRYGGVTPLINASADGALFSLSAGIRLRLTAAAPRLWGLRLIQDTGSTAHLQKLEAVTGPLASLNRPFPLEVEFYRKHGLSYIEPELREGHDEIGQAQRGELPALVTAADIRGELHAHSMSSDGVHSIEEMAAAARERGYEYIGITDHSRSLKIARGVSLENLWLQIRHTDRLNEKLTGFRILKSTEVDILMDGSLDYPDELLRELDYTVCSIHSRFGFDRTEQTERIMRAMDNRYFNILGHATGRLLLKRPGYDLDIDRIIDHASKSGCFFEINSSPDRLDLSAESARKASAAGVLIAVTTDSHSTGELDLIRCGLDQARRAGLAKSAILNCQPWQKLHSLFKR